MRLFSSWLGVWPKDLPRLYPDEDDRMLCSFLTEAEHRRLLELPVVVVLPFASRSSSALDRAFGMALSRFLIRDMMLVGNLSVHDADDTPLLYLEDALEQHPSRCRGTIWITGQAHVQEGLCSVEVVILRPDGEPVRVAVRGTKFREFLTDCSVAVADALDGKLNALTREGWSKGRPTTVVELLDLGKLLVADLVPRQRSRLATQLWAKSPGFSLAFELVENEYEPNYRSKLQDALRRDSASPVLQMKMFSTVRETRGHEPYALQYARKAIEISPGYARAHVAAAISAHPEVDMLRHLELGYRLLPGSLYAIRHYLMALCKAGRSVKELNPLVREAINLNPYDPENYRAVIDTFAELKQYRHALEIAKGLQQLFEPEINPRTRQCLERDPKLRQQMQSGEYDPIVEIRALLRELREAANFAG